MSFETLGDVNYLAVLVATVAWALLGAIWYAPPVLGRASFRASGWDMPERPPSPIYLGASLILYFLAALATAWIARETGSETLVDGLVLGVAVGIGYMMVLVAVTAMFERKPHPAAWFWINAPFSVLGLLIVGVIVSVWD
ncbi:MAG TPA: DUF1761 domain-containing protein [Actinomycetota bacterium]